MISFDEACAIVAGLARPLGVEEVPLDEARGRILAEPALAAIDSPRRAVSTMDGYAVREADLADLPASLPVTLRIYPGEAAPAPLREGTCARIFTGAPLPGGADRVVMQEEVAEDAGLATFSAPLSSPRFWRAGGSDFTAGGVLVEAGRRIGARELVAAAGGDLATLVCWRKPRVTLLATGDELAVAGEARRRQGAVPDSISPGICALIDEFGGETDGRIHLGDMPEMLRAVAGDVLRAEPDLVVATGGASVGERDFARAMFEAHGLELLFSKVAMKPGKPVWLGRCGAALVMGLPGNPTSALVTARLLLAPLVTGLAGGRIEDCWRWRPVELGAPLEQGSGREAFVRARSEGQVAHPAKNQDSGAQATLAVSDLLLRVAPHAPPRQARERVDALSF